jgi:hypothetical protein
MVELDDPGYLAQYDGQALLVRADDWPHRLDAIRPALGIADVDAAWLQSCRSDVPLAANPAKQLGVKLYERVPLIWSHARLAPHTRYWQACINHYAEAAAITATLDAMVRNWSMVRFPRFWNNALTCVYLSDGAEPAPVRAQADRMQVLLQTRRIPTTTIALPVAAGAATRFHAEALGEWVALYLAALYQVDPAARVAWDFLGL